MLDFINLLLNSIYQFAPKTLAILVIASAVLLFVLNRPQIALLMLLLQYILLALLVGSRVYGPLVLLRAGLGFAIYLVLLVSVNRQQNSLRAKTWRPISLTIWIFRVSLVAICGLAAYGLWRVNILHLDSYFGWVSYALMCLGITLAATSTDPLHLGLGIMVGINGFEAASVFMQQSLLVTGMWGVIDILLALAVAAGLDAWQSSNEVNES